MILNPCQSCPESHISSFSELKFFATFEILYPEILQLIEVTSSRNSMEILLNVSKIGIKNYMLLLLLLL
jgi:hypothetical protein